MNIINHGYRTDKMDGDQIKKKIVFSKFAMIFITEFYGWISFIFCSEILICIKKTKMFYERISVINAICITEFY